MRNLEVVVTPGEAGFDAEALLVPRLASVAKSIRQLMGLKLAPYGVVVGQEQFLLCLLEHRTLSVADSAKALAVRPSTISKMVDILERKGWMVRHGDEQDHRRVLVGLTPDGVAIAGTIKDVMAEIEVEFAALFAEDASVGRIIRKLDAVLVKRLSRLR